MKKLTVTHQKGRTVITESEIPVLVTETNLQAFVDLLNATYGNPNLSYGYEVLKVRARIWMKSYNHTSVWCFIDFEGNILFPAGWATPTKSSPIRGNIFDAEPLKNHKWSSVKYLR